MGEKILNTKSEDLGNLFEKEEEEYDKVFKSMFYFQI